MKQTSGESLSPGARASRPPFHPKTQNNAFWGPRPWGRGRPARSIRALLLLIAGALLANYSGAAFCQAQAQEPSPAVVRVTTRLTELNVIVQDKHGAPVGGLTREDFTLLDDGAEGGRGASQRASSEQHPIFAAPRDDEKTYCAAGARASRPPSSFQSSPPRPFWAPRNDEKAVWSAAACCRFCARSAAADCRANCEFAPKQASAL